MQPDWEIWLDNQHSSSLAKIGQNEQKLVVKSAYILGNASLDDKEIFIRAWQVGKIIIITKDADFPAIVTQYGCPPKVIKLNTGNLPTALPLKETQ